MTFDRCQPGWGIARLDPLGARIDDQRLVRDLGAIAAAYQSIEGIDHLGLGVCCPTDQNPSYGTCLRAYVTSAARFDALLDSLATIAPPGDAGKPGIVVLHAGSLQLQSK